MTNRKSADRPIIEKHCTCLYADISRKKVKGIHLIQKRFQNVNHYVVIYGKITIKALYHNRQPHFRKVCHILNTETLLTSATTG